MTSAAISGDYPSPGEWTTDDLDALPEDGRRRELLDGNLIVSPSPTRIHQTIAMRLGVELAEECPDTYDVTQGVEIRLSRQRALIPDVLVITDTAAARRAAHYAPHEVVLAVEIVSPSSQAMDRITKPALYAQAGIPFYWRVETEDEGIAIYTHRIDPIHEIYVQTGRWTKYMDTGEPWPINLSIARITPRHY